MSENNVSANRATGALKSRWEGYKGLSSREKLAFWGRFLTNNILYIILLILVIVVTNKNPNFLSPNSIINIVKQSAPALIMALGVGGIIVLTGTDLSAGRILGLTACVCAALLQRSDYPTKMFPDMGTWSILPVLLLVIVIGALIGLFNGFFVAKFKLHPFIVTLATQLMLYGLVLQFLQQGNNGGQAISGLDNGYSQLVKGSFVSVGGTAIPNYVWYSLVITIIMWVVWNKTTLGKNMYAVGSNPEAANVSGVNVMATTILIFTIAGILYGINGFIQAAYIGSNDASTGVNYELDAIAACVIGGISFTGGVGRISGIVTGVLLLNVIAVALQWLSVPANTTYIIKGAIILLAVTIDMQKYLAKK